MLNNLEKSFRCAFRGIWIPMQTERNMRIHTGAVIVVLLLSYLLAVSLTDFFIIVLLFAMVLGAELLNTAVEKICNILRDHYHLPYEASRDIRDIAAGAVLVQAIAAALIGFLIFLKYIL